MAEREMLEKLAGHASEANREKLASIFTQSSLERGQFVFFEGDRAESLYLIETGVVEVNTIHSDGKVYVYHFLFPGDLFGEGVLYGQAFYPFSAVVRKDAAVWKAQASDIQKVMSEDGEFKNYLFEKLGEKLDQAYAKQRCVAGERVEKRIACVLLRSLGMQGILDNCLSRFDTPLTNRDISGLIGSTEETVSRVMSRLKKEGVIGVKDKKLVVLDPDALANYFSSI